MKIRDALQNMLFPSGIKCIACGKELNSDSESGLCHKCLGDFALSQNISFCRRCGRFLKAASSYCLECQLRLPLVTAVRSPFVFEGDIKRLVHALKFGNARYLAPYLAKFMADSYRLAGMTADFITFVPMLQSKQKLRGYNQAQLLAVEVAKILKLPCLNVLDKVKDVRSTASLRRSQRKEMLRDSIEVIAGVDFGQKRILLVDDVYTTGTTVSECALKLKYSAVSEVYALTFATSKAFLRQRVISLTINPQKNCTAINHFAKQ